MGPHCCGYFRARAEKCSQLAVPGNLLSTQTNIETGSQLRQRGLRGSRLAVGNQSAFMKSVMNALRANIHEGKETLLASIQQAMSKFS